jgi:hypothetical protein
MSVESCLVIDSMSCILCYKSQIVKSYRDSKTNNNFMMNAINLLADCGNLDIDQLEHLSTLRIV